MLLNKLLAEAILVHQLGQVQAPEDHHKIIIPIGLDQNLKMEQVIPKDIGPIFIGWELFQLGSLQWDHKSLDKKILMLIQIHFFKPIEQEELQEVKTCLRTSLMPPGYKIMLQELMQISSQEAKTELILQVVKIAETQIQSMVRELDQHKLDIQMAQFLKLST